MKKDDNIIPPTSEIPGLLKSLRHPRKRTVSIGPQSQADAYEAMAVRNEARRRSLSLERPTDAASRRKPARPWTSQDNVCIVDDLGAY